MKLYEVTGIEEYLNTAKFFIDRRGEEPYYFDIEAEKRGYTYIYSDMQKFGRQYAQSHLPVRDQSEAVGHAVRAMYLYSGMADVAMHNGDRALCDALKRIWNSVVKQKMYITGAIGSSEFGEAFSTPYDLPNDRAYAETCASIGLMMFANRMLEMELKGEYADIMELALFNVVLGSMNLDGKGFFYVNPLEVYPELCARRDSRHVLPERQKWFACSCCPPNAIRTVMSVGSYAYSSSEDSLNIHLFVGSDVIADIKGSCIKIKADSEYVNRGYIRYELHMDAPTEFSLNIRIPGWSRNTSVVVNGQPCDLGRVNNGYLQIHRCFKNNDVVELNVDMKPQVYRSRTDIRSNAGKIAVKRGPFVYCMESVDNGSNLQMLKIDPKKEMEACYSPDILGGVVTIRAKGSRRKMDPCVGDDPYFTGAAFAEEDVDILMIPYYAWANRGINEMRVWVEEK